MITAGDIQKFLITEIEKTQYNIMSKIGGREGSDYILTTGKGNIHELYLKSVNLDKERDIKIPKHELGNLKNNLWLALVLVIEKIPRILYLIPSKTFENPDNRIFFNNNVDIMPQLSNWQIKIFTNAIEELSQYEIQNIKDKL